MIVTLELVYFHLLKMCPYKINNLIKIEQYEYVQFAYIAFTFDVFAVQKYEHKQWQVCFINQIAAVFWLPV